MTNEAYAHLSPEAEAFRIANTAAGVLKAKPNLLGGGTYILEDGTVHDLTKKDCEDLAVPVPAWDI